MALFVALAAHLEANYGTARLVLVWTISALGAGLVSAALENPCTLVSVVELLLSSRLDFPPK